jgi:hypothetical protein
LVASDVTLAGFPSAAEISFDVVTVFALNGSQTGVEEFALGDHHHVKPRRNLMTTESLSNETFSSISLDGSTNPLRRRNPKPADWCPVGQYEQGRQAAMNPDATFIHPLELRAPADVFVRPEAHQPRQARSGQLSALSHQN